MIPIALILLLIVIVFSIAVVINNPTVFGLSIFGAQIPVQVAGVYFTGAGAMLVLIVALGLLRVGLRRSRARRKEVKSLKKAADGKVPASSAAKPVTADKAADRPAATPPPTPKPAEADGTTSSGSTPVTSPARTGSSKPPTAGDQGGSTAAEREALLAQVDEVTGDDPKR